MPTIVAGQASSGGGAPGTGSAPSSLHLLGEAGISCGIGDFSKRLLATLQRGGAGPQDALAHTALAVGPGRYPLARAWRALGPADCIVANVPLVAWKRAFLAPAATFALAALRGRRRLTVLHEWGGLHRLRRWVLIPLLLLSDKLVLVSPQVREELAADPLVGFLARRAALIPLPPNLARPPETVGGPLRERLLAARAAGRLVLGHFGSIYPGKQPGAMLEVAASLKARGARPLLVFVGSFIKATDGIEETFRQKVADLDLADEVLVTGYVASVAEMFGLFEMVDAFAYVLPEGLTARRASVLACVQAGRPVVVTAPARADEFDHHPRFRALLETGAIVPAPRGSDPEAYADLILACRDRPTAPPAVDADLWFRDAADALTALMRPPTAAPAAAAAEAGPARAGASTP